MGSRNGTSRPGRDRHAHHHPGAPGAAQADGQSAIVIGGGIAGLSAATELAEAGVRVTLVEREAELGGRVRSWPITLDNGDTTSMSRGFHAFFRQYYQLRSLLRRVDPHLTMLRPVEDYPLVLKDGPRDSFQGIPRTPPWNLVGFVAKSPSFSFKDLTKVNLDAAMGLLDVEFPQTFTDFDGKSAADVLDNLHFPDTARHLALEVFARSFFADPREFSGGELVAMFHTYFVGSAEGLLFDVARDNFTDVLWAPLGKYLQELGVEIRTGVSVEAILEQADDVRVCTDAGDDLTADAVVIATDLRPLKQLTGASNIGDQTWRDTLAGLRSAPPFVVWRRWLDRPCAPGSADFLGTSGYGPLDNVSMIHQFEDSAAAWAREHNGSVVELHAYAVDVDPHSAELRAELTRWQDELHPELAGAKQLGEQWIVAEDCGLIDTSPWNDRPGVQTPSPRVMLAGDGIRCDFPVALMERAATTGVLAANALLAQWGVRGRDLWTAPMSPRLPGIRSLRNGLQKLART